MLFTVLSNCHSIVIYNFAIICLSEACLDWIIASDDENLQISGYGLTKADHSSNSQQGGVCVHYKNSLPLKPLDIHYLNECGFWIKNQEKDL